MLKETFNTIFPRSLTTEVPAFPAMPSFLPAVDVWSVQYEKLTMSLLKVCSWISSRHLEIAGMKKNPSVNNVYFRSAFRHGVLLKVSASLFNDARHRCVLSAVLPAWAECAWTGQTTMTEKRKAHFLEKQIDFYNTTTHLALISSFYSLRIVFFPLVKWNQEQICVCVFLSYSGTFRKNPKMLCFQVWWPLNCCFISHKALSFTSNLLFFPSWPQDLNRLFLK